MYHWQLIDIFVYFSHHFVTIPPPCWTNAAHTHGVPVLGTLITESDDGAARCSKFLEDTASWQNLANQLVDIAEYYRFDGWLVNIENPIQVQFTQMELLPVIVIQFHWYWLLCTITPRHSLLFCCPHEDLGEGKQVPRECFLLRSLPKVISGCPIHKLFLKI